MLISGSKKGSAERPDLSYYLLISEFVYKLAKRKTIISGFFRKEYGNYRN